MLDAAVADWRHAFVDGYLEPRLRARLAPVFAGRRAAVPTLIHRWGYHISIFTGDVVDSLYNTAEFNKPILGAYSLTHLDGCPEIVADPFLIRHEEAGKWYIFAETKARDRGAVISYAESSDLKSWTFRAQLNLVHPSCDHF